MCSTFKQIYKYIYIYCNRASGKPTDSQKKKKKKPQNKANH